jgi:hypothetical protein
LVYEDAEWAKFRAASRWQRVVTKMKLIDYHQSSSALLANLGITASPAARLRDQRSGDVKWIQEQAAEVEEKIDAVEHLLEQEAFDGDITKKKAMDYEDRLGVSKEGITMMQSFYMCPKCGIYMPSKFWRSHKPQPEGLFVPKQRWYCAIQWDAFEVHYPEQYKALLDGKTREALDELLPFCRCRYKPFAHGEASVVEWKASGDRWWSMLADIIPEVLLDEIQKVQSTWFETVESLFADELLAIIPVAMPKCNPLPNCPIPGIGRFDVAKWKADGMPIMTTKSWWQFALAVATRNHALLKDIFDKATAEVNSRL